MSHEIGQLDISDRPLLNSQAKASEWTEIGEATITHTIFGGAKVRITRKHDRMRRALLLFAVLVIAIVAWQGWAMFQRGDALQSADSVANLNENAGVSAPASQLEHIPASATSAPAKDKAITPAQSAIANQAAHQKALPHSAPAVAKPMLHQPLRTLNPQSAPLATNNNAAGNQMPLPPLAAKQSVVPVAAFPRAAQTAASSPASVTPLNKGDAHPLPAGESQPLDTINAKH